MERKKQNVRPKQKIPANSYLGGKRRKDDFLFGINQYNDSKADFIRVYHTWLPRRRNTLAKLRSLYEEVHEDAMSYNKTQVACKELSFNSRAVKQNVENSAVDFFVSLTAFVGDAVGGLASFAEACKVDSFKDKFKEIMDSDAEITKELYASRSRCVAKYQGIEEMMRDFYSNTFISTTDEISNALQMDKHWAAMKNAYQKDDMPKLFDAVCDFFSNACQPDVLEQVEDSIRKYVDDNPAAIEGCKSTGKAVCGAISAFGEKKKDTDRESAMEYIGKATNLYLMLEDKKQLDYFKNVVENDTYQNKLELQIKEAIDSLESEMREMELLYYRQFQN